jgi:heavy metal efflux system protein
MLIVPVAIALIFVLLYLTFSSPRYALLVVGNIPFAVVGGIAALWIRGLNPTFRPRLVSLFGVAILSFPSIKCKMRGTLRGKPWGCAPAQAADRAHDSFRSQLRIPMATSTSTGGEVQRPLASVVICGLVSSTMLTLFLLPVLYDWTAPRRVSTREVPGRQER